jgi:hypothetical protein
MHKWTSVFQSELKKSAKRSKEILKVYDRRCLTAAHLSFQRDLCE